MLFLVVSLALVSGGQAHILGHPGRRRAMHIALWLLASVVLTALYGEWAELQSTPDRAAADRRAVIFLCTAGVVALMLWLGPTWARKRLAAADTWGRRTVALATVHGPMLVVGAVFTFFADFATALSTAVW